MKSYTLIRVDDCFKKLKINSLDYQELMRHPYLSGDQARAIIAYRQQHGDFVRFDQLKNIHLLDQETYNRIYPYLGL